MQIEVVRKMPSWKKFAVVDDMNETTRAFALSGLRQRNPGAFEEQIHRLLAELFFGTELAEKVYGPIQY